MEKYHIGKNGTPSICQAEKGNCPLGGIENHYSSLEAAQTAADMKNQLKFGIFGSKKNKLKGAKKKNKPKNNKQAKNNGAKNQSSNTDRRKNTDSKLSEQRLKNDTNKRNGLPPLDEQKLKYDKDNKDRNRPTSIREGVIRTNAPKKGDKDFKGVNRETADRRNYEKRVEDVKLYSDEVTEENIEKTKHLRDGRDNRTKFMKKHYGEGKVLNRFLVKESNREDYYIHECYDNGRISIYTKDGTKAITTIQSAPDRIALFHKEAGVEYKPEDFERAKMNRIHYQEEQTRDSRQMN